MMAGARGRQTVGRRQLSLIWLCSAMLLAGQSNSLTTISSSPPPTLDDVAYSTTTDSLTTTTTIASTTEEESSVVPSTERTSNAIPEAEQSTSELLKKYNAKKLDKESPSSQADQLDKPYPYLKKDKAADKENAIRQAKRSGADSLALNGTLQLSMSPKSTSEASTTAETTTTTTTAATTSATTAASSTAAATSTLLDEQDSTTPKLATTVSDDDNDQTTTQSTLRLTESTTTTTAFTDKSSVGETGDTESTTPLTTWQSTSTTLTIQPSTTTTSSSTSTSQSEAASAAETDAPTTVTESPSTTDHEEPSTTPLEQDRSTMATTPGATVPPPPEIITTAEPTVLAASTKRAAATTITLLPSTTTSAATTTTTTTTSTTTTTTTTTTAKPSSTTTFVSPKSFATTTMTSEPFSAVTTWPDETSEPTTEPFSPTPTPEDVTLLVRIVLEGSWQDVCSKLPILRQSLTDLLNKDIDKPISTRQIIFHQTQCSENLTPTSLVTDTQLTTVLVYVVDEKGNFDGKLTKVIPSLYESSPINFPLTIHSVTLVPEADSGNAIAVVIVSCVAFICLILLAGLLVIMRKRQGRFNYGERCRPVSLDAYSLDSVSAYNSVRRSKAVVRSSKRSYGNPAFEDSSVTPTHPLNFAGIATFCNDTSAVAEEFAGIPQIHSKIDELPPGAEIKNRYANVIPLPETRVPLQRINNDPLSEYINASYVRGPKNATKYYIACQAPTEATVADFWRMIWEQQCKVIIMLTDLVENGVDKCTEYIPPLEVSDCHRLYGDYQVTLKKREAKEKYAISTLHLKNLENNTFREVSHIWYLWPANGVPTDATGLIAVLLEARALQRGAAGPILVHCSPGTGRTGTLIALDLCIRQYEVTRTVDVPRVVYTIRRDRAGAVQTREQYLFVYKGLNLYASKLAGGGIDST